MKCVAVCSVLQCGVRETSSTTGVSREPSVTNWVLLENTSETANVWIDVNLCLSCLFATHPNTNTQMHKSLPADGPAPSRRLADLAKQVCPPPIVYIIQRAFSRFHAPCLQKVFYFLRNAFMCFSSSDSHKGIFTETLCMWFFLFSCWASLTPFMHYNRWRTHHLPCAYPERLWLPFVPLPTALGMSACICVRYIYLCVCTYICIHMCIYEYIHIYICTYI